MKDAVVGRAPPVQQLPQPSLHLRAVHLYHVQRALSVRRRGGEHLRHWPECQGCRGEGGGEGGGVGEGEEAGTWQRARPAL